MRNRDLHFVCRHVNIRVENDETPYTNELDAGACLSIPIAHAEGNYVCDGPDVRRAGRNRQIIFRYCDENGEATDEVNPNGSRSNIAGICNREGNVLE